MPMGFPDPTLQHLVRAKELRRDNILKLYDQRREQLWKPLADELDEDWEYFESVILISQNNKEANDQVKRVDSRHKQRRQAYLEAVEKLNTVIQGLGNPASVTLATQISQMAKLRKAMSDCLDEFELDGIRPFPPPPALPPPGTNETLESEVDIGKGSNSLLSPVESKKPRVVRTRTDPMSFPSSLSPQPVSAAISQNRPVQMYNERHAITNRVDCPQKNCSLKGRRGFTRKDALRRHLRITHKIDITKRESDPKAHQSNAASLIKENGESSQLPQRDRQQNDHGKRAADNDDKLWYLGQGPLKKAKPASLVRMSHVPSTISQDRTGTQKEQERKVLAALVKSMRHCVER